MEQTTREDGEAATQQVAGALRQLQEAVDGLVRERARWRAELQAAREELAAALLRNEAAVRVIQRLLQEREENGEVGRAREPQRREVLPGELASFLVERQGVGMNGRKQAARREGTTVQELQRRPWREPQIAVRVAAPIAALVMHPHRDAWLATIDRDRVCRVHSFVGVARRNALMRMDAVASAAWMPQSSREGSGAPAAERLLLLTADGALAMRAVSPQQPHASPKTCLLPDLEDPGAATEASLDVHRLRVHESGRVCGVSSTRFRGIAQGAHWALIDLPQQQVVAAYRQTSAAPDSFGVSALAQHPDGLLWATAGHGPGLLLWDVRMPEPARHLADAGAGHLVYVEFANNGYSMGVSGDDGSVRLYDLRRVECLRRYDQANGAFSFHHSGFCVAIAHRTETAAADQVQLYTTRRALNEPWGELTAPAHAFITGLSWCAPTSTLLASARDDGSVYQWRGE